MKYAYILVAVILLSLPQIGLSQCYTCDDDKTTDTPNALDDPFRLSFGFNGVTIVGQNREPLTLTSQAGGFTIKMNKAKFRVIGFADFYGWFNQNDQSGKHPLGGLAELTWPIKSKSNKYEFAGGIGMMFAYGKGDGYEANTLTFSLPLSYTLVQDKKHLIRINFGPGLSGVRFKNTNTGQTEWIANFGLTAGIMISPKL